MNSTGVFWIFNHRYGMQIQWIYKRFTEDKVSTDTIIDFDHILTLQQDEGASGDTLLYQC